MSENLWIKEVKGTAIPLNGDDVDTDRIIPARFLKSVTFEDLGDKAFFDERFDTTGKMMSHPFNDPQYSGGSLLISGKNFGCGSSREHAPQALYRYGIRGIIGESFAEIFRGNCLMLGIPTVSLQRDDIGVVRELVRLYPSHAIKVYVEQSIVEACGMHFKAEIPDSMRSALLSGLWHPGGTLRENIGLVKETYNKLSYIHWKHNDQEV